MDGQRKRIKLSRFSIVIIGITIMKLILMGLFSSDYQRQLFIPFVLEFVSGNTGNPYQYFWENGITNAFPYPIVMLLIESIAGVVVSGLGITSPILMNFIFKLPILLIDFLGLYFLVKMFPEKRRYAAVFYYSSPIIIYAIYMHGQLDLIPTVFLLGAVYFLLAKGEKNYWYSVFFLSCAMLSKLHIMAVLPIIFLYLKKRDGWKKTFIYFGSVLGATFAGFLPFLSEGFLNMVLLNPEQSILTQVSFKFVSVEMYLPILAILLIYLITYGLSMVNKDLLLAILGVTLSVFLVLVPPMPGWYVWIVPFITMFFITINEDKYRNITIYVALNVLYLVYFIFFHKRAEVDLYFIEQSLEWVKIDNYVLKNIIFTLMAGTLIYITVSMYRIAIAESALFKRKGHPFTIGVAGDSGAGKSTFINVVEKCLGHNQLLFIEGDGDHKWERGDKEWNEYTHLNPKANYLYRQAEDLAILRKGATVKRVEYDHDTGKFTVARRIVPKRYIMLCGLHPLYLPQTRKNLDLKIYMDVDETLRRFWKIERDTAHRGYTKEKIIQQIEARLPDAVKYIYPQKNYADLIIRYYDKNLKSCMAENHTVNMSIMLTFSAAINVEPLVTEIMKYGIQIRWEYSEDLQKQTVDIEADKLEEFVLPVEEIARKTIPHLDELTRENFENNNAKDGILMLFFLLIISDKILGEIET